MISMNRPKMESRPYEFLLHHEIKRRLLPGRKVMTNLDSILKSRDITLSTNVHLVKAVVFPDVTWMDMSHMDVRVGL